MLELTNYIDIYELVTFFCFEFSRDYVYKGESHDFWELIYIDKGQLDVMAGSQFHQLTSGQMIFHKPNEFHAHWANLKVAPNVIVTTFRASKQTMTFFEEKVLTLSSIEKQIFHDFVITTKESIGNHKQRDLLEATNEFKQISQFIKIKLELFLLTCLSRESTKTNKVKVKPSYSNEDRVLLSINSFLDAHITQNIKLHDISNALNLSESFIKQLFSNYNNRPIMTYYKSLRINMVKDLIRESDYSFTEIAAILNYTSIHSFSRQFKHFTGMTPSEYKKSLIHMW